MKNKAAKPKASAGKHAPSPWRNLDCDEVLLFLGDDGDYRFDCAIIGAAERFGGDRAIAYDKDKVLEVLMRQGMDREEAQEWYEFNIVGAWLGEHTPIFISTNPMQL